MSPLDRQKVHCNLEPKQGLPFRIPLRVAATRCSTTQSSKASGSVLRDLMFAALPNGQVPFFSKEKRAKIPKR